MHIYIYLYTHIYIYIYIVHIYIYYIFIHLPTSCWSFYFFHGIFPFYPIFLKIYFHISHRFKGRLTAPTALPPGDGLLHGSHGHSLADEVGGWTSDAKRPHQPQVTDQPWVTGPGEKPMGKWRLNHEKWRFKHEKWRFNQFNHEKWMILVNGHAGQEPIYWRYRFHIFLAYIYISGLNFQGISPENIWPKIWYSTNVPPCIGSWVIPIGQS